MMRKATLHHHVRDCDQSHTRNACIQPDTDSPQAEAMNKIALKITLILCPIVLAACSGFPGYYRTPIVQGNTISPDKVAKLEFGMTRRQVKYLLGTPLVNPKFEPGRLTYVFYYRNPRVHVHQSKLVLYFSDNALTRVAGSKEFTSLVGDQQDKAGA